MPLDVLLTAGSRRVPLVNAFRRVLGPLGGRVITTDVNALSPAVLAADVAFRVPLATDPGYMAAIEGICREEGVGLLVPTIDDELEIVGSARARFEAWELPSPRRRRRRRASATTSTSPPGMLRAAGIAAAASWLPADAPGDGRLPLFVKPRYGRGSIGAFAVAQRA